MGKLAKPQRSKKNKKIKAVDPFYKGNRKDRRAALANQKPKSYEQEIPRKLRMLGFAIDSSKLAGSGKKSKNKFKEQKTPDGPLNYKNQFNTPLGATTSQPKPVAIKPKPIEKEEKRENNETPRKSKKERRKERYEEIQRNKSGKRSKPEVPTEVVNDYIDKLKPTRPYLQPKFKQRKTETTRDFLRRVDEEVNFAVNKSKIDDKFEMSDEKKMRESMKKTALMEKNNKKQRLKEKKERKQEAVKEKKKEKILDFHALQDSVAFGEVVHAPPSLTVRPKKVKDGKDKDKPGRRMPELHSAIAQNVAESKGLKSSTRPPPPSRAVGKTVKRKDQSNVQKLVSDAQRESAIEAYRQMKKRKT